MFTGQERVKKILTGAIQNRRVANAYLFVGPIEAQKVEAALSFAELLACKKQDIIRITGGEKGSIKIEQIRELRQWVRYGPSASQYLVAMIEGADQMTDEASASFLKTLEEPARGVVFILIAEREEKIPVTIVSRCQKIIFAENLEAELPKIEINPFENIQKKTVIELLEVSAKLYQEKEREEIESLLDDLVCQPFFTISQKRILLNTLRSLKKHANLKLALDLMYLRLGQKENYGAAVSHSAEKI